MVKYRYRLVHSLTNEVARQGQRPVQAWTIRTLIKKIGLWAGVSPDEAMLKLGKQKDGYAGYVIVRQRLVFQSVSLSPEERYELARLMGLQGAQG